ncbi:MAG: ArsR/SmtB family transcription factor [Longimicrobiales bacterium]
MDSFTALAAAPRRRILGALRAGPGSVNDLAAALALRQPAVSKHLKVLREAGFVSCRGDGQRRIYELAPARFTELERWLEPYRVLWSRRLDALELHLDREDEP